MHNRNRLAHRTFVTRTPVVLLGAILVLLAALHVLTALMFW